MAICWMFRNIYGWRESIKTDCIATRKGIPLSINNSLLLFSFPKIKENDVCFGVKLQGGMLKPNLMSAFQNIPSKSRVVCREDASS